MPTVNHCFPPTGTSLWSLTWSRCVRSAMRSSPWSWRRDWRSCLKPWLGSERAAGRQDSRAEEEVTLQQPWQYLLRGQADIILFVRRHAISTFSCKSTISKLGDMEKGRNPVSSHEPLYCFSAFWLKYCTIYIYIYIYYSHACLISPRIKTHIS